MSRVVSAPLVISKDEAGHDLYLYEGAELPSHVDAKEVARLDALGFLAKPGTDPTPDADRITQEPDDEAPATS